MHPSKPVVSVFLLTLLVLSGCAGPTSSATSVAEAAELVPVTGSTVIPRTTGVPTMRPTSAEEMGIALDEDGRPYDNYWGPQDATTETELLTSLQVPGGRLEVVDGDALYQPLLVTDRETESVSYGAADELDLRIIWQRRPAPDPDPDDDGTGAEPPRSRSRPVEPKLYPVGDGGPDGLVESILGVQVAASGSTVARWGRFEKAYETGEGLGALTSRAVLDWAGQNLDFGQPLLEERLPADRPYLLADLDGVAGTDLFLFDNGGGPGTYMLTEGFDDQDRLVAIMLWAPRYPWRLAVPVGTPPPDVVEREQQLIDCIDGRRLIDLWGRCT